MRAQIITAGIAAAALAVAATPAAASTGNAAVQKKAVSDKKVCRLLDPPTGSLIKQRVCLTEEQWKKVEKQLEE